LFAEPIGFKTKVLNDVYTYEEDGVSKVLNDVYMYEEDGVSTIIIPTSRVLYTACGDMAQIYKRVEDLLHPCWIGVHINGVQFLAMGTLG
jgi:hypothetical protein